MELYAMQGRCEKPLEASVCHCRERQCVLYGAFQGRFEGEGCRAQGVIKSRTYGPHQVLFHEASSASQVFLLKSGFVKLTTALPDGRSQVLRLGAPWQVLGMESLGGQHYPYRAEAAGDVTVCTIAYKDFLRALTQDPRLSLRVIQSLNRELQRSNDMIRNLGLMNSTERIAAFLLSMATGDSTPEKELPMPLSRKEMAEMLGLTLETVSRVISRLVRDKIIEAPRCGGHFRILDRQCLAAVSGMDSAACKAADEGSIADHPFWAFS